MIPSCDHTGTPLHFHSSTTSGSASLTRARSRPSVVPRQSPSSLILASIRREGDWLFRFMLRSFTSSLWKFNRISQARVHVLVAEGFGQGKKAWLTSAMTGRYCFHAPFIAQCLGNAPDFRFLCENEVKAAKNAVHAIFNRARGGENFFDAGM